MYVSNIYFALLLLQKLFINYCGTELMPHPVLGLDEPVVGT